MLLYHYRPYRNAWIELERQTLYFAGYEELNDPMEGYMDIVWRGDKIAWQGLLRNYICSLDNALSLYLLQAGSDKIREQALLQDIRAFDNVPYGNILSQLSEAFLADDCVKKIVCLYGERQLTCGRKELQVILRMLHFRALGLCIRTGVRSGTMPEVELAIAEQFENKNEILNIAETDYWSLDENVRVAILEKLDQLFEDNRNSVMAESYSSMEEQRKHWLTITLEYPAVYVEKIVELIHPHMYLTCFSASGKNSSMWGNYAENHRGICLIYDTHTRNDKEWLSLRVPYCYHGNGKVESKYCDKELHKVIYENEVQQINFFTMLGTLTGKQLENWLVDAEGNRSSCMDTIYTNKANWLDAYWKSLDKRYCRKSKDWAHEEEYRILLPDTFWEFHTFESRCISYDFNSLKGLIFGMKISEEKKYEVIHLVRNMCANVGRDTFEFYQAEYDVTKGSMRLRRMNIGNIGEKG